MPSRMRVVGMVAGSVDVVRVLLKNKADVAKHNLSGQNAEKLMEMSPIISKDSSSREKITKMLHPDSKKVKESGCVIC